ncbi:MAG: GNAT family N-acetyltransferase [Pirellulaceae bacterium]|nr:GNAT family N-acetyltransferase [Planctomycetales bacterium]
MSSFTIRRARLGDRKAADYICMKTGDSGDDGEPFFREDPGALGRIYVGPYLALESELAFVLEDDQGVCGYTFGAFDSRVFYARYERQWRPDLCAQFPRPTSDSTTWNRVQLVHHWYHEPNYFCPEPYDEYPSHLHIDLLERAQGQGNGRRLLERLMHQLRQRGSPGVHLGVRTRNTRAIGFYHALGFRELIATAEDVYMGKKFDLQ